MSFQASYSTSQSQITFLQCDIVSSYQQGANDIYNITARDPVGNTYTGMMQRSVRGEFIVTQLTPT